MTSLPSVPSIDDIHTQVRQKVDEETVQLEERNAHAPFSRLHPEIVLIVQGSEHGQASNTALLISWVCQSWRTLALNTSELWVRIDTPNICWVDTALSRAGNRPIDVNFRFCNQPNEDIDRMVVHCTENLGRLRKLSLDLQKVNSPTPWRKFLLTPAPVLVELTLRNASLPPNPSAPLFPSLEGLSLDSCEVDWETLPIRTGLKRLSIMNTSTAMWTDELMDILSVIGESVEVLRFQNILLPTAPINAIFDPNEDRQHLPRIKSFSIVESGHLSVMTILNQLTLSLEHHDLNISVWSHPFSAEGQLEAVHALAACRGFEDWPVESLEVIIHEDYMEFVMTENWGYGIDDSTTGDEIDGEDNGEQVKHISLHVEMADDVTEMISIIDVLPLQQSTFKSLTLSGSFNPPKFSTLTNSVDEHGDIDTLRVNASFVHRFTWIIRDENKRLRAILGVGSDSHSIEEKMIGIDDATTDHCLDTLSFFFLETLVYYDGDDNRRGPFPRRYFKVLQEWLRWRRALGVKLKNLKFERLEIQSRAYLMSLFDGIVDMVDCTGVTEVENEMEMPLSLNA